jgi:hypothetical protein
MVNWCGRGVQPWAANQLKNGSGIVPVIRGDKHAGTASDNGFSIS